MKHGSRLNEVRQRLNAVSAWPWCSHGRGMIADANDLFCVCAVSGGPGGKAAKANTEFIVNAPNDVDFLLSYVQELKQQLEDTKP